MKLLVTALVIIILILAFLIFLLRLEILKINDRLKRLDFESNQLLEINLFDRSVNTLTETLNEQIIEQRAYRIAVMNREQELKETISNISHDLRTPLTAIIGYLQLLEREELSKDQAKSIKILLEKSLTMKKLTQAFFELSYFDSQLTDTELVRINLSNLLIDELLKESVNFDSSTIEPQLKIQEDCFVLTDKKLLTRVLQNLIVNVLQHGQEKVIVELTQKEKTVLKISNKYKAGTKIDTQRIFQRYYVADNNETNRSNGLGLAIVELLCHRLGIKIKAVVDPEYFTICLEVPSTK
ncbi:sensor histidine kinase [Enterococcus malodoratus]|uniref:sensor histidine kinase n=1 Tax=Enterococcus malodoratus TaxID=71451 RepID=UPI0020737730|nr:HAMP domain-containing sensor histidine kinase [Enterococcus malodoratus]